MFKHWFMLGIEHRLLKLGEIRFFFQQTGQLFVLYFIVLNMFHPPPFFFYFSIFLFSSFSSFARNEHVFLFHTFTLQSFFFFFILIDTVQAIGIFLFQPAISLCPLFTHRNFSSSLYLASIINCSLHSVNHISKINARFRFIFFFFLICYIFFP